MSDWFGFNFHTVFENHDRIKLHVESPLLLVVFLFCFFVFLSIVFLRRRATDGPFSVSQTDQMKGIAILMILVGHLFGHALPNDPVLFPFRHLGSVGVTLFLMLSGYGLSQSLKRKGVEGFFFHRVTRIYIPIFLVLLPEVLLTHFLLGPEAGLLRELARIVVNLPAVDRNMWFVQFIFFWYCLIFITFRLKLSDNGKVAVLILAALALLTIPRLSPSMKINAFSFPLGCWMGFHSHTLTERTRQFLEKNPALAGLFAVAGIFLSHITLALSDRLMAPGFLGMALLLALCAAAALAYGVARNVKIHPAREWIAVLFVLAVIGPYLLWVFHGAIAGRQNLAAWVFGNLACLFLAPTVILIPTLGLRFRLSSKFLVYMGGISYEMFLIHGMFMYSFDFILFRGPLMVTFPVYFGCMCLLSAGIRRVGNRLTGWVASKRSTL